MEGDISNHCFSNFERIHIGDLFYAVLVSKMWSLERALVFFCLKIPIHFSVGQFNGAPVKASKANTASQLTLRKRKVSYTLVKKIMPHCTI